MLHVADSQIRAEIDSSFTPHLMLKAAGSNFVCILVANLKANGNSADVAGLIDLNADPNVVDYNNRTRTM